MVPGRKGPAFGSRVLRAARDLALLVTLVASAGCGSSGTVATVSALPARGHARAATGPGAGTALRSQRVPASPRQPPIVWDPIPFGPEREAQMVAYVRRHYGSFMNPAYRLIDPRVIVIHYTDSPDFRSTYNTFAADVPDPELHELPNTCAHFVIDRDGTIHQLVRLGIMCRHTVGLNWTAIAIEHVGYSDAEVLNDHAQLSASLRLARWLRCRFHIQIKSVIGHNESLSALTTARTYPRSAPRLTAISTTPTCRSTAPTYGERGRAKRYT